MKIINENKRYSNFIKGILLVITLSLITLPICNYVVDPCGYFRAQDATIKSWSDLNTEAERLYKAKYIVKNIENYNAHLLTGSKGGALQTSKLSEIDGYKYYNMGVQNGIFNQYEAYCDFILKRTKCKKIIIHISGVETIKIPFERYGSMGTVPAYVSGTGEIRELSKYLYRNIGKTVTELIENKEFRKPSPYPTGIHGERNLMEFYGRRRRKGREMYTNEYVLQYAKKKSFHNVMDELFLKNEKGILIEESLESLKRIKKSCDNENVELQVIIGATFIGQMHLFESKEYWRFIEDVVDIVGDTWDFSNINDINLNPYNFSDTNHYFTEVGNLMIDTITKKKIMMALA